MIKTTKKDINSSNEIVIPKMFWKYYDLYRRQLITMEEFAQKSGIEKDAILFYVSSI